MLEFNPDGSIKMPDKFVKKASNDNRRMQTQRCVKIRKEIVNDRSPKKCALRIELSSSLQPGFVEKVHGYFVNESEVPSKVIKVSDKEYDVEIGTCFRRCSDCNALVAKFRHFLNGNVILDIGSCTYKGVAQNFCYEDHFD
ncbi:hypothetical protein HN419_06335 [Candidatus Woesearchaeota archaeon]|jgi:hypothetical protein|nr:hypothetical protein [Candidatus Woesearchaeota archaeon]MBT3538112.1 hypothetical protein [Candidatus Woesearchaeota archaeon]MBT4697529.1 hypothetical protein [Candidatus Woesearchaeota archaeon]MBT4717376.1 hypothetical protein [Candidatus Woesearchaeota archaeon]MBT7105781.1 hypothetical protein [Candidatus Woesearchaeota archaeon]